MHRQPVTLNAEQVRKLAEIEAMRPDLQGYTVSRKVHVALQEWFKACFEDAHVKGIKRQPLKDGDESKRDAAVSYPGSVFSQLLSSNNFTHSAVMS